MPEGAAQQTVARGRELGVLFGRSGDKLLLRPPLVITEEEIIRVCGVLRRSLSCAATGESCEISSV